MRPPLCVCGFSVVCVSLLLRGLVVANDANAANGFCDSSGDSCGLRTSATLVHGADQVVSYEQLKDMLSTHSVQLIDVRNPDEFMEGHIPQAANVPLGELEDALQLSASLFKEKYEVDAPRESDDNVVFYCQRGRRSEDAVGKAQRLGFLRARHYAGGYTEWGQHEGQ